MNKKKYKIKEGDIKKILGTDMGCIASDMITVEGMVVGYMYREEPVEEYDSGWRFFSGQEDDNYVDNPDNFSFYKLNTIANYDLLVIGYLNFPVGSSFERSREADKFLKNRNL
ncbi:DUF2185 domain-containing protein [Rurimicrobium arvi]|uniref:Immunity protein Imm33 domain-containing protein n=1 Tax=Rurimicrobium arvi TaxID=2049916 RepID=A0ABP8MSK6_9BACT